MLRKPAPQLGLQFLDRREHFLPIKPQALHEHMLRDSRLSPQERRHLARLFELIASRAHMEFRSRLEHLKAVYEAFDPDLDTQAVTRQPGFDERLQRHELAASFERHLLVAN